MFLINHNIKLLFEFEKDVSNYSSWLSSVLLAKIKKIKLIKNKKKKKERKKSYLFQMLWKDQVDVHFCYSHLFLFPYEILCYTNHQPYYFWNLFLKKKKRNYKFLKKIKWKKKSKKLTFNWVCNSRNNWWSHMS